MTGIKSIWEYGLTRFHIAILILFAKLSGLDKNNKTEEEKP
jgi:hypothetical protein